jgi:hypothetical protein
MMRIRYWILAGILSFSTCVWAQEKESLPAADTTALSSLDSLSIFNLIDSLLMLDDLSRSQLGIRMGYNSNVLSAGRTLGIENFGLSPGISYFHRSGLYADASAYYSKDFDPSYYLTVASLGYMEDVTKNFSFMLGYDHYFYNLTDSYLPYTNTISVTPIVDFKPVSFSATYSFYFGDQYAHRIMPCLNFTLEKRRLWKIDRIAIVPSVYVLFGNEVITTIEYLPAETRLQRLRNERLYNTPYPVLQTDKNVFGIMNYAFSVPLRVNVSQWSLSLTYTYNIPKALPGEVFTLSESTFLSGSLMYLIEFRRNKKPL